MVVRLVLAVALAVALLATSLPAVEDARTSRTDALVRDDLREVRATARHLLAHDDPVAPGTRGARRLVAVRLPASLARPTAVRLGTRAGATDALAWGRAGPRHALATRFPVRAVVDGRLRRDGRPLVLREPGRHRLALGLRRVGGRPVVTVRRFKPGNATRPGDARRERRLRL